MSNISMSNISKMKQLAIEYVSALTPPATINYTEEDWAALPQVLSEITKQADSLPGAEVYTFFNNTDSMLYPWFN